ncbi:MAG: hypothetical protein M5U35_01895 [Roseovarius sp.]|nr:hypothetical protein [Roseovarius sp.]
MGERSKDTESFSITLPIEAVDLLVKLIPLGLYGKKKATVASNLILDQLKQMVEKDVLK